MRHFYRLSSTLLMLLLFSAHLSAQEDSTWEIRIGAGVGYEWGTATYNFDTYPGYAVFREGTTKQRGEHLDIELSPGGFPTPYRFSIRSRLEVFTTDIASILSLPDAQVLLPGSADPITQGMEHRIVMNLRSYEGSILLGWNLPYGLSLHIGPSFGLHNLKSVRNTQSLVGMPSDVRWTNPKGLKTLDSGRTLVLDEGEAFAGQNRPFAFGALLIAACEIPLFSRLSLMPELRLRGDFLSPINGAQWRIISPGIGISVAYRFDVSGNTSRHSTGERRPDPLLRASIDLYGTAENGERRNEGIMRTRTVHRNDHIWMPGVVRFDTASSDGSDLYRTQPSGSSSDVDLDSLSRLDPLDVYPHLLDIVGRQLQLSPDRQVTLTAIDGDDGDGARTRADRLRDYFVGGWGIDSARFTIRVERRAEDLMNADRLVRIDYDSLPFPIRLEHSWLQRTYAAPRIVVAPRIESETGVMRWTITFRQNGRELARQTSDETSDSRVDLGMILSTTGSTSPAPLEAELAVTDSNGTSVIARDTLALTVIDENPENNGSSEVWNILDGESDDIHAALAEIARTIPTEATVTIAPLSLPHDLPRREPGLIRRVASTLARLLPDNVVTTIERPETERGATGILPRSSVRITVRNTGSSQDDGEH